MWEAAGTSTTRSKGTPRLAASRNYGFPWRQNGDLLQLANLSEALLGCQTLAS